MNKLNFLFPLFFLLLSQPVLAQREDTGNYEYDREYLLGVNKNTNGGMIGGVALKVGTRIDDSQFAFFGLELANVKHPKEVRYTTVTGNNYIFGKSNYLYAIRPHYGREVILFKKAPNQGVQVSALGAVGPSIGLIAPYFIEYALNRVEAVVEQYDPAVHQSRFNILGTGRLLEGVGQSELALGGMAKAALYFEFGVFKSNATGLEVGYQVEGFQKKIPLILREQNRQFFQSAYFTLFFGFRK
ncbi:MAG: hypothetical protein FJX97_00085 [Bacteroidetes bacterium]|nr:hypothetical protein [Bacteroidota bacterium]